MNAIVGLAMMTAALCTVACDKLPFGDQEESTSGDDDSSTKTKHKSKHKVEKRCSPTHELTDEERYRIQSDYDDGKSPCPGWDDPELYVGKTGLTLNGETVEGNSIAGDNIVLIRPLKTMLGANRESWKSFHPNKPFPGKLTVVLDKGVGNDAGISVMQTAALAGYPHFTVDAGGDPVTFSWQLPEGAAPISPSEVVIEQLAGAGFQVGRAEALVRKHRNALQHLAEPKDATQLATWFTENCAENCPSRLLLRPVSGPMTDTMELVSSLLSLPPFKGNPPTVALTFGCAREEIAGAPGLYLLPWGPRFPDDRQCKFPKAGSGPKLEGSEKSGKLPPEVVQRVVRTNFGRFRLCYQAALKDKPNLKGKVTVRFVISRDGTVSSTSAGGDIPDEGVISCVARAFYSLTFPKPEGGIVTVSYPIVFTPNE